MSPPKPPPRAASRRLLRLLKRYECRNTTFVDPDGSWPLVWVKARDCEVWDADGRRYLDLTAAFSVAAAGHANPAVVAAAQEQLARLPHAMGDVHPHPLKGELARTLSRLTFERWSRSRADGPMRGKTLFGNSGFEAVEAALKTALLASGRPGVIAFEKAYHGLGYGALNATHGKLFRSPFRRQLREFADFAPFPTRREELDRALDRVQTLLACGDAGAVLVEPIQGRGGIRVPPAGFLRELRRLCDERGALLVVDEIYTGFGRTGRWFACEEEAVTPDLICLGKALTGGFPLSACVGRAEVMDAAWPESDGEAIHTSTFLGHPVGCAMALAQIEEIRRRRLPARSRRLGKRLKTRLERLVAPPGLALEVRGRGLMVGVELRTESGAPAGGAAVRLVKAMLRRGRILLPEGEAGETIAFTPPLTIEQSALDSACDAFQEALDELEAPPAA